MVPRKLGRDPEIGKRWPYKSLNYLPTKQLWKFLAWKSGGNLPDAPFQIGKNLTGPVRLLILLPEDFQQVLVAFPAVQSLVRGLPDSEFLLLAPQALTGFLAALFGPDRVTGIRSGEFHWGEAHFRELLETVSAFRPGMAINLRAETPPLLHYLIRSSGAAMRVQLSGEGPRPFANIFLQPEGSDNHLRRYLLALRLWDFSERPIPPKWTRLGASPENLKEAFSRLAGKGLRPESTRLFLWQGDSPAERELFQATVRERAPQGAAQSLVVINGAGTLWNTPPPPQDLILSLPWLEVESTGLLLGLFAQSARSIGNNGPLVQLAGIADTDVSAHFTAAEEAFDTSFLNPRLTVIYGKKPD